MDKPLVSIIIPIYNTASYLDGCIQSAREQSYRNIEIILIDDGSTDESGKKCDEYRKIDDRIKVIHQNNGGLGLARNSGLDIATGKYVTFIDSDDYIDKNLIEYLINKMSQEKEDFCKTGFRRFKKTNTTSTTHYKDEDFRTKKETKRLIERMLGSLPQRKDSVEMCVCGNMYVLDIIRKNKIRFVSEKEYLSEDLIFNMDYFKYVTTASLSSYIGYNYRINETSLTKIYRSDRFIAMKRLYVAAKERATKYNYSLQSLQRLDRLMFTYLKSCISQEKNKISKKKKSESIRNIKRICADKVTKNLIKNYPKRYLGAKQKLFLYLVKNKKATSLYLLANINVF